MREIHTRGRRTREWIVSYGNERLLEACGLEAVGWVEAREGYCIVRPQPALSLIYVSLKGRGEVWLNGEWFPCEAGQAYLAPIGAAHAYRTIPGVFWKNCWVVGRNNALLGVLEPALIRASGQALCHAIQGLHCEDMGQAAPAVVKDWVELILHYARRIGHPDKTPDRRLAAVWEGVVNDLAFPWTLKALAQEAGLSEESVRRVCRQEEGRAPLEHVTYLRMRSAASLLACHSGPLAEVAEQIGYASPFTFSAAFKRVMGVAPSFYRAANEERAPKNSAGK